MKSFEAHSDDMHLVNVRKMQRQVKL